MVGAAEFSRSRSSLAATQSDLGQRSAASSSSFPFPVPKSAPKSDSSNNTEAISVKVKIVCLLLSWLLLILFKSSRLRKKLALIAKPRLNTEYCSRKWFWERDKSHNNNLIKLGRDSQETKLLEKFLEIFLEFKKFFKKSFLVLVNQDSNLSTRNAPFSQYAQEIFQEI